MIVKPSNDSKPKQSRSNQTLLFWGCAAAIILVILFLSLRSISFGYFNSFVLRDETASTATSYFEGLLPSEEEQALLAPLQEDWDSFRNSRLADEVSVIAPDGAVLRGDFYNEGGTATVIYLHHYDGTRADDFLAGPFFTGLGCNLLLPDARNHGESGGEYTGFGALEADDLRCWLDWAEQNLDGQPVILYGSGMGAVTALLAAEAGLPDNVAFLVAESPYSTLDDIAAHLLMQSYKVPSFPVYPVMQWKLAQSGAGYAAQQVDVTHLTHASLPVLFLLGTEDRHVPAEQTQAVYDAYPGQKALFSRPVGFSAVYAAAREDAEAQITTWFDLIPS